MKQEVIYMPDFNCIKLHRAFFLRVLIFILLFCSVLAIMSLVLIPKEFINSGYPGTSAILGFYDLPEESLDVLFLGSSHAISGIDTQKLYDDYGYKSYTLGCGEQNMAISYFYLEEALKTQHPKVVALETLMAFPFRHDKVLYSSAAASEKALNFMRPGVNRLRAVYEISGYESELNPLYLLLRFMRYHERWDNLDEKDILIFDDYAYLTLHGYAVNYGNLSNDPPGYRPFDKNSGKAGELSPVITDYLLRIVKLCRDNDIKLILFKTPSNKTGADEYQTMSSFAAENSLLYMDFNEEGLYEDCGFDFTTDMGNLGHANFTGAEKITESIGKTLVSMGITAGNPDREWDETEGLYNICRQNFLLSIEDQKEEYLSMTENSRYSLFIVSSENGENTVYVRCDGKEVLYKDGTPVTGVLPGSEKEYEAASNKEGISVIIGDEEKIKGNSSWYAVVYDEYLRDVFDVVYSDENGKLIHM